MLDTRRSTSVRTPSVTDDILDRIGDMPESSTRELSKVVTVFRYTVWRDLRDDGMHSYHEQRVQGIGEVPGTSGLPVTFQFYYVVSLADGCGP